MIISLSSLCPSLSRSLKYIRMGESMCAYEYVCECACVPVSECVFGCVRKRVRVRMCAWASAYGRMYVCKCERVYVCVFVDKGWVCLFGCVCVHNCLMHVRSFFCWFTTIAWCTCALFGWRTTMGHLKASFGLGSRFVHSGPVTTYIASNYSSTFFLLNNNTFYDFYNSVVTWENMKLMAMLSIYTLRCYFSLLFSVPSMSISTIYHIDWE